MFSIAETVINNPIPIYTKYNEDWKTVPVFDNGEKLVSLRGQNNIQVQPHYYIRGIRGAVADCLVRESVKERLEAVASYLPQGYQLLILDAWRPVEVQSALYSERYAKLQKKYPSASPEQLSEMTSQYVASPSTDENCPSPHLTGGAVDLTLIYTNGRRVPMGTSFDSMDAKARTDYYEKKLLQNHLSQSEYRYLLNRRLLYHVMILAGFSNYAVEWWHYDFGNQLWAINHATTAFYGKTSPEQITLLR